MKVKDSIAKASKTVTNNVGDWMLKEGDSGVSTHLVISVKSLQPRQPPGVHQSDGQM